MYFVDSGYQRTHGCLPPVVVSCAHTHTIATIRIINTIETNSITTRLALNECWDFFFLLSINSFAWISPGTREPRDRYRFTQNVAICRLHDDTMTEYYSNFVARFSFLEFFFVFKKIGRFFLLACESEIKMSDERQAMINHVKWRKKNVVLTVNVVSNTSVFFVALIANLNSLFRKTCNQSDCREMDWKKTRRVWFTFVDLIQIQLLIICRNED